MILSEPKSGGGAHYYGRDPESGEVELTASGMREARKTLSIPSATTIEGVVEKYGLWNWKMNNVARRAIHAERLADENDDQMVKRIISDASQMNVSAMSYGTYMHAQAEAILNGQPYDENEPFVSKLAEWIGENITKTFWTEKALIHPTNLYAGRADALVEMKGVEGPVLLDWKTQRFAFRSGKCSPNYYDSYPRQLAAYADCIGAGKTKPRICSVAINTNSPSVPVARVWTEAEQAHSLRAFMLIAELWCILKKYDPRLCVREEIKEKAA